MRTEAILFAVLAAGCASQPAPCEPTSPAAVQPVAASTAPSAPNEVTVDRAPSAPTPTAAPQPTAPQPAATTPSGLADPFASVTTAPTGPAAAPTGSCTVHINSIPASRVELDGMGIGSTPRVGVVVTSGVPHRIVFRSDTAGTNTTTFQCVAGETRTVATRFDGSPAPAPGRPSPDPLGTRR